MDENWFEKWFSNRGQAAGLGLSFVSFLLACATLWRSFQTNEPFFVVALLLLGLLGVATLSIVLWFRSRRELVGVISVREVWAGMVDEQFLRSQKSLDAFFKDGYRFFDEQRGVLLDRLMDTSKTTRVFIVHPDYNRIEVIAEMDPDKATKRGKQKDDCLRAISTLQEIVEEAVKKGIDPRIRNHFLGYHHIPTYNAILGDKIGFIHLYYTKPYLGVLNTLHCKRTWRGGVFNNYKGDIDKIARETETVGLWDYGRI